MGSWLTILGAKLFGVAFSFAVGGNGSGGKTPPRRKSDLRENEFDDAIADFDRMFGNGI